MEGSDRPVRVPVVEDDQEIAQVLQRSLRMEGYDVRLTGDGARALDETQAFLPDLIVLDLGLPGMDGIEVARTLRDDENDTPILILTARAALDGAPAGGGPDAQPRHPRGDARGALDRPHTARVRAARVPDAQRAAGDL